jgi:hypothetical protein
MTVYELMELMAAERQMLSGSLSTFLTVSSAAFVGAYVAGERLTRGLTVGLLIVYTIASAAIFSGRHFSGLRMIDIANDIRKVAAQEGVSLDSVQNITGNETMVIAYVGYFIIWAAVVIFVVYARARVSADEK